MTNQELLAYIIREEQEGFVKEVIQQALLRNGYTKSQVEEAFAELERGKKSDTVHDYVQEYARQGKSAEETFTQLQDQGYQPGQIKKSINNVYGDAKTSNPHTIMFAIMALAVGAGGMWLTMNGFLPETIAQPTYSPSELIGLALEDVRAGRDGIQTCNEKLEGVYMEKCYTVVAAATEDSSLCTSITSDDVHDSCWMTFIDSDFDTVCNTVRLSENKQTCQSIRLLRV